jgi:hypothetical protein
VSALPRRRPLRPIVACSFAEEACHVHQGLGTASPVIGRIAVTGTVLRAVGFCLTMVKNRVRHFSAGRRVEIIPHLPL